MRPLDQARQIMKALTYAKEKTEALKRSIDGQQLGIEIFVHADNIGNHTGFAIENADTVIRELKRKGCVYDKSVTAQRLIEDLHKLVAFVQDHEAMFDDLQTNYSIDETLTLAANRIKEHADILFSQELKKKLA